MLFAEQDDEAIEAVTVLVDVTNRQGKGKGKRGKGKGQTATEAEHRNAAPQGATESRLQASTNAEFKSNMDARKQGKCPAGFISLHPGDGSTDWQSRRVSDIVDGVDLLVHTLDCVCHGSRDPQEVRALMEEGYCPPLECATTEGHVSSARFFAAEPC